MESFLRFLEKINSFAVEDKIEPFGRKECMHFGNIDALNRYVVYKIPKKNKFKKYRTIYAPEYRLKMFLKYANRILTEYFQPNKETFGFVKGLSVVDNASLHTRKKYVCNLDIKDFFPSITYDIALGATLEYFKNIEPQVIEICIKASCVKNNTCCFLAQGSPLSPLISNIVCEGLDLRLATISYINKFVYSRYADDLTFSTNVDDLEIIDTFIKQVIKNVNDEGFVINEAKTRIQSKFYHQSVTGITVNEFPNIRKSYIKDLRNILYIWNRYGYWAAVHRFQKKYRKDKKIPFSKEIVLPRVEDVVGGRLEFLKLVRGEDDDLYLKYNSKFLFLKYRDIKYLPTRNPSELLSAKEVYRGFVNGQDAFSYTQIYQDDNYNYYTSLGLFEKLLIPNSIEVLLNSIQDDNKDISHILNRLFYIRPINKKDYKWVLSLSMNYNNSESNYTIAREKINKLAMKEFNKGEFGNAANLLRIANLVGDYKFIYQYITACKLSNQDNGLIPSHLEFLEPDDYSKLLKTYAHYYIALGFSISPIAGNSSFLNSFKTPLKEHNLKDETWKDFTGIGIYLGKNEYRCLDIDGLTDNDEIRIKTLSMILSFLELPFNYSWVIQSGSNNGYHIIFRSKNIKGFNPEVLSFASTHIFKHPFKRIELRWNNCFLTCVPSLHSSGYFYKFRNGEIPTHKPQYVELKNINSLLDYFCGRTIFKKLSYNDKLFSLAYRTKLNADSSDIYNLPTLQFSNEYLVECNTPECLNELALNYLLGNGVEKNTHLALACFERAKNVLSAYNLASLMSVGFIPAKYNLKKLLNQCKGYIEEERICQIEDMYQETYPLDSESEINKNIIKYLFFDTETTGLPTNYDASIYDVDNWPRLVQLSWIISDDKGNLLKEKNYIIYPKGFIIPNDSVKIHGITNEFAKDEGYDLKSVLDEFVKDVQDSSLIIGHNIDFDKKIIGAELYRNGINNIFVEKSSICTMKSSVDFCAIPGYWGYKWPSLQELYQKLFNKSFADAHNSLFDIRATKECFFKLKELNIININ